MQAALQAPRFRPDAGLPYERMFSAALDGLLLTLSDVIDDMLLGDYTYVSAGERLYADVDYHRKHPIQPARRQAPQADRGADRSASAVHQETRQPPPGGRVRDSCAGAATACTPAGALRSRC
jgi:hypothetical protein